MTSVRHSGSYARSLSSAPSYPTLRRAASVSGGRQVQMSYASNGLGSGFSLSQALTDGDNNSFSVADSKKATMQNLNHRLASYLDKVRSLESANAQLERQIREWYEKRTPTVRDYSKFQAIINELMAKINLAHLDNSRVVLQIDNVKIAAEDFKVKYESEHAAHMLVSTDICGLRKVLDELTLTRSDLEMQLEGFKEERIFLKKNHEEELAALRRHTTSQVNVEVDATPQEDLSRILTEIRTHYEGITEKNRCDVEAWYTAKYAELNKDVATRTENLQSSQSEINELKRSLQALQIELQSQHSMENALKGQLGETENRYTQQMAQLQIQVNSLESEIHEIKEAIKQQSLDYQVLLDIKTKLELEIAEYRRLLDGEEVVKPPVIEIKEEKRKPIITQRTKVIIEELVDGQVVSRTEDVGTETVSQ